MGTKSRLREVYWQAMKRPASLPSNLGMCLRAARGEIVQVQGVRLRLGLHLSLEILQMLVTCAYEAAERRMIDVALEPGDRVLEVGTGMGFLAALCATKVGSQNVFTYEGNPAMTPIILETFALNGVSPHFEQCLVGGTRGEVDFNISDVFWSSSTKSTDGGETIRVPVKAFTDIAEAVRPTFVILDVEGAEVDLVPHIRFEKIRKLAIETHPWIIGKNKVNELEHIIMAAGLQKSEALSTDHHFYYERS